jgi:hypothetical protein
MLRLDARPAATYLYLERVLQSHISRFALFRLELLHCTTHLFTIDVFNGTSFHDSE